MPWTISVAKHYQNGAYFVGRPGSGKTHVIRQTLTESKSQYVYRNGRMTPMGLYEQLALHCTKMGQVPHEGEHRFGTVANQYRPGGTPVYAPKPTNLAAKALTSTLARFRFEKRLDLQNQEEYALVFRKQGQHRIAVWTTSATQHVVKIPSAAGEFDVVTHTGEKQMPVTNAIGTAIDVMVSDCLQYGR